MKTLTAEQLQSHISETIPPYAYQTKVAQYFAGLIETKVKLNDSLHLRIVSKGRGLMYVDPGLGKTRMAIMVHQLLCPEKRSIVVCKRNSLNTWRREYTKWWSGFTEDDILLVYGTAAQRRKMWQSKAKVIVTTWDTLKNDFDQVDLTQFEIMFGDECQKIRNHKTQLFKFYKKHCTVTKYLILMSGTLLRKGPQDLWTSLHLCSKKLFPSYWKYFNTYCETIEGFFGQEYVGPKNTAALARQLASSIVRLEEDDDEVASVRPPLIRDYLPIQMSTQQERTYNQLNDHMATLIPESGKIIVAASPLSVMMKMRQLLVCPKILDPALGYGAAIEHAVSTLEDDPHQVFFTPFKKAVPFLKQAIMEAKYPEPYILQGGTSPATIRDVEERFGGADGSSRCCIVTVKFAESFELPSAKQGRFIGFEWTVDENRQAEERLHRLTTPHPVNILYYKYDYTIEGELLQEALDTKARNIRLTMQDYINVLRGGTHE